MRRQLHPPPPPHPPPPTHTHPVTPQESFEAKYDWKGPQPPIPPNINRDNPVGSYFRDFDLPADWNDHSVILHFGGVSSAFYLWINVI
ncbi:MAG: hypothetical protein AAGB29_07415, partial [Planctomycetota bacterium]